MKRNQEGEDHAEEPEAAGSSLRGCPGAEFGLLPRDSNYPWPIRPSLLGSLVLHGLVFVLIFYRMSAPQPPDAAVRIFPVDVVLSDEIVSPPQPLKADVPLQQRAPVRPQQKGVLKSRQAPQTASLEPYRPNPPASTEPAPKQTGDELQAKLEAFAKLRLPDSVQQVLGSSGTSQHTATSYGAVLGPEATYSVNDFIRAQVERRWNLDLAMLEDRNLTVSIHVVLTRDGVIKKAEIVKNERYRSDATYHSIALSARNAVLLSSPIALPPGRYRERLDIVLNLNPKDTLK